jgi:putative transposase
MSRTARAIIPTVPHHVTQTGNRNGDVFFSDDDRQQYLLWLSGYCKAHGVKVWAYCLMTNHIHLIAVPASSDSFQRVLRPMQMRHAQRVNAAQAWRGHLWGDRYYACALDDRHLWEAVRYVERNPVRAGVVSVAETYPWSSARAHCGPRNDPVLSYDLPLLASVDNWSEWLRIPEEEGVVQFLRHRTRRGLPCGGDAFVKRIAGLTGLDLADRHRGRPRKMGRRHFP